MYGVRQRTIVGGLLSRVLPEFPNKRTETALFTIYLDSKNRHQKVLSCSYIELAMLYIQTVRGFSISIQVMKLFGSLI